ncbi:MAG: hypothetical protein ACD_71C00200G0001 [uncultured bacterium (gcode 4)]|uniref:Uncharacterized protein n=1 Tax=uncultured bacterium (gcode 4) TaxID=1234023 RepID=K2A2M6_9BACT|nr:MAG: hypothetical protein ACD_71C00200G0001 [uncultured bacterium (gcode 4)]HBB03293.1 hypothetical protein [Candidatus Gracilibacteria bacterium]
MKNEKCWNLVYLSSRAKRGDLKLRLLRHFIPRNDNEIKKIPLPEPVPVNHRETKNKQKNGGIVPSFFLSIIF